MQFDIDKMAAADRYEMLLGTVVPRRLHWLRRFQVMVQNSVALYESTFGPLADIYFALPKVPSRVKRTSLMRGSGFQITALMIEATRK